MRDCARMGMHRSSSWLNARAATKRLAMLEHMVVLTLISTTRAGPSLPLPVKGHDLRCMLIALARVVGVEADAHDLAELKKRVEGEEHRKEALAAVAVARPNGAERHVVSHHLRLGGCGLLGLVERFAPWLVVALVDSGRARLCSRRVGCSS
eukprot:2167693-Pleurochrysis_carterae.AAC.1